jgi:hypothetical protein
MVYYGLFKWPKRVLRRYYSDLANVRPEIIDAKPKIKKPDAPG